MKIFISGLPKSGKTTLVKKIYKKYKDVLTISGFYTEEVTINKKRIGFNIYSIDLNTKLLFASKTEKSNVKYAGYFLFIENLEKIINFIKLDSDLLIIDEIGKMEMLSKKFENFITECLNKDINLIATLHRSYFNIFSKYGKIFWLTKEKRDEIFDNIIKIIEESKYL